MKVVCTGNFIQPAEVQRLLFFHFLLLDTMLPENKTKGA